MSTESSSQRRSRIGNAGQVWMLVALLIGAIVIGEATPLDVLVQDCLFDSSTNSWLVDATAPTLRLLFYDGPKALIIALGVALIVLLAGPARWRAKFALSRVRLAAGVAVLALVPSFVGFLKARSDVYCPAQLDRYGGDQEFRRPFTPRHPQEARARRGRCWPAGHASGGFALIGLTLLARSRKGRRIALALGMVVGWTMGIYQMMKGAHFLSHTVVTMLIASLVTAFVAGILAPTSRDSPSTEMSN